MPLRTLETWTHGAILLDAEYIRCALWAPEPLNQRCPAPGDVMQSPTGEHP